MERVRTQPISQHLQFLQVDGFNHNLVVGRKKKEFPPSSPIGSLEKVDLFFVFRWI